MFNKILIANRGEIACRIARTCKEMGIPSVTIYSKGEENFPHRFAGDESCFLGEGALKETYLNQELILSIAKKVGADAIHPGYGFLSENSSFARRVDQDSIKLIGPSASAMEKMGDKKRSKELIEKLKVPSIPGYHGDDQSSERLKRAAKEIGFPVLIKASAGGGGKGMRVVTNIADFERELEGAKREAINAFGDDRMLIEKYLENPRHIEIQVMCDQHGNHLYLFERECSIQRRHQKIIEESPSTAVSESLLKQMGEAAIKITKEIHYEGAGTIEFMLDEHFEFYFLEMNTRLQVEHPVTEMITGLDLVRLQIEVASGKRLPYTQERLSRKGHAIEVRLYAEDPDNEFLPTTGKIHYVGGSEHSHVRLDKGYGENNEVGISFDPMLAKLIVWDETRELAIKKMLVALDQFPFIGIKNNRSYLKRVLAHPAFKSGETYTHFVKSHAADLTAVPAKNGDIARAVALFLNTPVITNEKRANEQSSTFETVGALRSLS